MKELITITKGSNNNPLTIVDEKKLKVRLNEKSVELEAYYNEEWYPVQGNIYLSYIIVKGNIE